MRFAIDLSHRHRFTLLALLATAVAGCGLSTSFTPTNRAPHPLAARSVDSVELFTTGPPQRAYTEVGILTSNHESAYSAASDNDVLLGLRTKAAQVGCDGVVVTSETTDQTVTYGSDHTTSTKRFRAACIVYKEAQ